MGPLLSCSGPSAFLPVNTTEAGDFPGGQTGALRGEGTPTASDRQRLRGEASAEAHAFPTTWGEISDGGYNFIRPLA